MVNFDVILGMDRLHASFATIDCRTGVVKFNFPNEPVIEWKDWNYIPRGQTISCLKDCKMNSNGCLYNIVRVKDLDFEIPPIVSIPVISEFSEVFPNDLPVIPPKREYDFCIELLPDTNPI